MKTITISSAFGNKSLNLKFEQSISLNSYRDLENLEANSLKNEVLALQGRAVKVKVGPHKNVNKNILLTCTL